MILVSHRTPTTLAGCANKAAAGATTFELDVQLGPSGSVVVSHFLPLLGILEHDNWRLRRRGGVDPSLAEQLRLIPVDCQVLLDPKETALPRQRELTSRLIDLVSDPSRFVVSTRDLDDLDSFRTAGFRTWRTIRSRTELQAALSDGRFDHPGISIRHTLLTPALMSGWSGIDVVAWTVNDGTRARELVDLGVAGVTTDSNDVLAQLASTR